MELVKDTFTKVLVIGNVFNDMFGDISNNNDKLNNKDKEASRKGYATPLSSGQFAFIMRDSDGTLPSQVLIQVVVIDLDIAPWPRPLQKVTDVILER